MGGNMPPTPPQIISSDEEEHNGPPYVPNPTKQLSTKVVGGRRWTKNGKLEFFWLSAEEINDQIRLHFDQDPEDRSQRHAALSKISQVLVKNDLILYECPSGAELKKQCQQFHFHDPICNAYHYTSARRGAALKKFYEGMASFNKPPLICGTATRADVLRIETESKQKTEKLVKGLQSNMRDHTNMIMQSHGFLLQQMSKMTVSMTTLAGDNHQVLTMLKTPRPEKKLKRHYQYKDNEHHLDETTPDLPKIGTPNLQKNSSKPPKSTFRKIGCVRHSTTGDLVGQMGTPKRKRPNKSRSAPNFVVIPAKMPTADYKYGKYAD